MLRWCWLVSLAACGFRAPGGGGGGGDDAAMPDVPSDIDAPPDMAPDLCFGSFVEVCLTALPGAELTVNSGQTRTINTAAGSPDCVATMPAIDACVVSATTIIVNDNGAIRGTGPRPLILLATGSINVNSGGVIDVASRRGTPALGAGANSSRCMPGATPTVQTGGWGGTNATKGGNGDRAGAGSGGGEASPTLLQPNALFGGCPGAKGAGSGGAGGNGGAGGGAVDLIAMAMVIDGTVNASGAGASGATGNGAGGGGGGSGGMIILDAPNVTINGSAVVLAQGGGGGEGSEGGGVGGDGADPTTPSTAAAGGGGGGAGGDGGAGAIASSGSNGGQDQIGFNGGGGGGGGAGFIKTTASPRPQVPLQRVCPPFS